MKLSSLAVPGVYVLIFFLAYTSQPLLLQLDPEPVSRKELVRFNILLICLLITYTRSVFTNAGHVPMQSEKEIEKSNGDANADGKPVGPRKWCQRCDAAKPPRSHHCSDCKRCIQKMDHHCPWTANCVSHTTFPHFIRFLFYAVTSMLYLTSLLYPRAMHLWSTRHLPYYLGPSIFQLGHLFSLCAANFVTLFAVGILLAKDIWCMALNQTTIEGWEISRHETLLRRARYFGGYLEGPDGAQIRIEKQEFPFDIGIWENLKQAMGTANVVMWFWPLSATLPNDTGLSFPVNGFSDPKLTWPPPDPDRFHRRQPKEMQNADSAFTYRDVGLNPQQTLQAFRKRQEDDVIRRRKPFAERLEAQVARGGASPKFDGEDGFDRDSRSSDSGIGDEVGGGERGERGERGGGGSRSGSHSGEESWRNSEGERLRDFGLDEDVEFYDEAEDNLPLSELIARRKEKANAASTL